MRLVTFRLNPSRRGIAATALAALAAVSAAVAMPAGATAAKAHVYDGPDVASYQHPDGAAIHWAKVKKAGKDFAIVKATEGTSYVNPWFASDYSGALSAGLVHGSYHFARPATPVISSAQRQAEHFASVIGSVNTARTLPPVLDLETTGGLSRAALITWAQTFLLEMRSLTGRTPMLYTYPYFWSRDLADPSAFERFPLWMAAYGTSTAPDAALWQYTDHAKIAGISGAVDESKLVTPTAAGWDTLSDGALPSTWPAAAPAAPSVTKVAPSPGAVKVSWVPEDAGSAPISSYTVTATPSGRSVTVSGATTAATVSGLHNGTAYQFSVVAHNSVGASAASALSAPATPAVPTSITTTLGTTSVPYASSVRLTATLTRRDRGTALAGEHVLLYRRPAAGGTWTQRASLTTDANGVVSQSLHPRHSLQLEFVFPGVRGLQRADVFADLAVRPKVTAAFAANPVRVKHVATLTGTVTPAVTHQTVERECLVGGKWRVFQKARTTSAGAFHFRFRPTVKTTDVYRVVALAAGGRARGYSPRYRLTVD